MSTFWRAATISAVSFGLITGSAQMAVSAPGGTHSAITAEQPALHGSETLLLTPDELLFINSGLMSAGRAPLPDHTVHVRVEAGGTLTALGPDGAEIPRVNDSRSLAPQAEVHKLSAYGQVAAPYGILNPEIKNVIESCLGFSIAGSGMHAIVEQFNTWDKAAKFLVRRFGIVGAVSCAGGIIWHYI